MNQNHTDITVVLDRSGSMQRLVADTIGGFNSFLDGQRKGHGTAAITLNHFDHEFEHVIKAEGVQTAPELTTETYVPRGNTALLDAIGRSIVETGERLSIIPENDRPAKVVFVIITDGLENASKEYSPGRINKMIQHQREKYGWEFVFLAANQNAIATGTSLGVSAENSMTYANNPIGTKGAFHSTGANLCMMRSGASRNMKYTGDQRVFQRRAGATQEPPQQ